MRYLDEFRDPAGARVLLAELRRVTTRPWRVMEICGGQTHAILRYGIDQLIPPEITLLHGPGCPVCVTPLEQIDKALELAARPEVIFTSFGDMLRVPGSHDDLLAVRARGGDVRIVYSPLEAVELARQNPSREVVFFAVGFETTAPGNAMAVSYARRAGVKNFTILVSHVLVPPAIEAILSSPDSRVQAFLAAGHVCAVEGYEDYEPIAERFGVPIAVTGFEPVDILAGLLACVRQLENGRAEVENLYARVVQREGNRRARGQVREVFEVGPRKWRGIGEIPLSGLRLRAEWAEFDAEHRFALHVGEVPEPAECWSGLVLQGVKRPDECPAFETKCTPGHPLGATMVSSEGACAAYYRYKRHHG